MQTKHSAHVSASTIIYPQHCCANKQASCWLVISFRLRRLNPCQAKPESSPPSSCCCSLLTNCPCRRDDIATTRHRSPVLVSVTIIHCITSVSVSLCSSLFIPPFTLAIQTSQYHPRRTIQERSLTTRNSLSQLPFLSIPSC